MDNISSVRFSRHEIDFVQSLSRMRVGYSKVHINGDLSRFAQRYARAVVQKKATGSNKGEETRRMQFSLLKNYIEIVYICDKDEKRTISATAASAFRSQPEFETFRMANVNVAGVALIPLKSSRIIVVIFAGLSDSRAITSEIVRFVMKMQKDDFNTNNLLSNINALRASLNMSQLKLDFGLQRSLNRMCKSNDRAEIEKECAELVEGTGTYAVISVQKTRVCGYLENCFSKSEFTSIALSPAVTIALQLFSNKDLQMYVVVATNEIHSVAGETYQLQTFEPLQLAATSYPATPQIKVAQRAIVNNQPPSTPKVTRQLLPPVQDVLETPKREVSVSEPQEKPEKPKRESSVTKKILVKMAKIRRSHKLSKYFIDTEKSQMMQTYMQENLSGKISHKELRDKLSELNKTEKSYVCWTYSKEAENARDEFIAMVLATPDMRRCLLSKMNRVAIAGVEINGIANIICILSKQ